MTDERDPISYPFDQKDVIEKGTEEERIAFMKDTIAQLDSIDEGVKRTNDPNTLRIFEYRKDELVIGRLIHFNLEDKVPPGYSVNVYRRTNRVKVMVRQPYNPVNPKAGRNRYFHVELKKPGDRDMLLEGILGLAGFIRGVSPSEALEIELFPDLPSHSD